MPLDEPRQRISLRTIDILIPARNVRLHPVPVVPEVEVVVITGGVPKWRTGKLYSSHTPSLRINVGSDRLEIRGKEDLLIRRGNTVQADILLLDALRGERAGRRERLRAPTMGGSHLGEVTLKAGLSDDGTLALKNS